MTMTCVHMLKNSPVKAEEYHLPAEKLLAGNPAQKTWTHYTDASGKFFAGLWQSEPGKWAITYTEEEYCHILEGRSIITDAEGNAITVNAGDEFIVPSGFTGSWEVVETTTKRFVIYEAGA